MVRALLRLPLFYKILIANAAIVLLGAVAGTAATVQFLRAEPGHSALLLAALLALAGVAASVLVNALILRLALKPLRQLEETAARVQEGDLEARAPRSLIADRELERLTRTFNGMLDNLATFRQRLREIAARALEAEEEERKRIARELHDDTAQRLAALLMRIRVARRVDDPAAREQVLEEMRQEIGDTLEGVRHFARGLRPPALEELGLLTALEVHARTLKESVGLSVTLEADPLADLLSSQAELALYRIVQEALTNVVRHAQTGQARVYIAREAGRVSATIEDEGRGFHVAAAMADGRGLGLFGMQERAAYVGGRVEIHSRPGQGTRVRAEIPITGPEAAD